MADGTQELETTVDTGVEPRQTCLDARLVDNARLALWPADVQCLRSFVCMPASSRAGKTRFLKTF